MLSSVGSFEGGGVEGGEGTSAGEATGGAMSGGVARAAAATAVASGAQVSPPAAVASQTMSTTNLNNPPSFVKAAVGKEKEDAKAEWISRLRHGISTAPSLLVTVGAGYSGGKVASALGGLGPSAFSAGAETSQATGVNVPGGSGQPYPPPASYPSSASWMSTSSSSYISSSLAPQSWAAPAKSGSKGAEMAEVGFQVGGVGAGGRHRDTETHTQRDERCEPTLHITQRSPHTPNGRPTQTQAQRPRQTKARRRRRLPPRRESERERGTRARQSSTTAETTARRPRPAFLGLSRTPRTLTRSSRRRRSRPRSAHFQRGPGAARRSVAKARARRERAEAARPGTARPGADSSARPSTGIRPWTFESSHSLEDEATRRRRNVVL